MNKYINTLELFAKILNKNNITWGLGGSFLLYFHKITNIVHDIDIIIDKKDYEKLLRILEHFPYIYHESDETYLTTHFFTVNINDIKIDLMIDFKVKSKDGIYSFPFNQSLTTSLTTENNVDIYLSSLEEWYNAYRAMNRQNKIQLLEEYYEKNNS